MWLVASKLDSTDVLFHLVAGGEEWKKESGTCGGLNNNALKDNLC